LVSTVRSYSRLRIKKNEREICTKRYKLSRLQNPQLFLVSLTLNKQLVKSYKPRSYNELERLIFICTLNSYFVQALILRSAS
jgi:hypothetical protein